MRIRTRRTLAGLGLLAVATLVCACRSRQPTPSTTHVSPTSTSFQTSHPVTETPGTKEPQLPPARERLSQLENQYIYYIASPNTLAEGQIQLGIWRASLDNKDRVLLYSKVYSQTLVRDGEDEDWRSYSWNRLTLAPDKQTLAFVEHSGRLYSRLCDPASVWTISVDGSNLQKRATFGPNLGVVELVWSPDASRLGAVLKPPLRSSGTVALVDLETNSVTLDDLASGFAFAPAGQNVILSRSDAIDAENDAALGLYLITGNKAEERLLPVESGDPLYPDWSPDGSEIAYSRDGIYSLNLNDRKIRQLAAIEATGPLKWSPDGRFIAYVDEKDGWLRVVDKQGNQMYAFVRGFTQDVQWSDDGQAVLASGSLNRYVIAFIADGATAIIRGQGAYGLTW